LCVYSILQLTNAIMAGINSYQWLLLLNCYCCFTTKFCITFFWVQQHAAVQVYPLPLTPNYIFWPLSTLIQ